MAKLYTSITNEAGKIHGLAGNEYLDIDIKVGNQLLTCFTLRRGEHPEPMPESEGPAETWVLYDENDEPIYWL